MWPKPQFPADLVIFTEEILNEKLHYFVQCTIKNRFEQPNLNRLMSVEERLLKAKKKIDVSDKIKHLELYFSGDFNPQKLQSKLDIFPAIFNSLITTVPLIKKPVNWSRENQLTGFFMRPTLAFKGFRT